MGRQLLIVFLVALALAGCRAPVLDDTLSATPLASPSVPSGAPPTDFAVRFVFGTCTMETLDTFEHTFARQITRDDERVIPLTLTNAQMAALYDRMMAIDLWSYPETFVIRSETGNYVVRDPSPKYRITVRAGGETKMVYWYDEIIEPTTPEADRLRSFFRQIIDMVHDHPDVRALPQPTLLCD